MKRFVSLWVCFFYIVFSSIMVRPASAILPAIPLIIPAAAVGAAMIATAAGQYYLRNPSVPTYVPATPGAAASVSDYIFTPSVMALGPISLITAASYPTVSSVYVGVKAALGFSLDDAINFSKTAAVGICDAFKEKVLARTSSGGLTGGTWSRVGNQNVCINYVAGQPLVGPGNPTGIVPAISNPSLMVDVSSATNYLAFMSSPSCPGDNKYLMTLDNPLGAPLNSMQNTPPGAINMPGLKDDLIPWLAGSPSDISNMIKNMGIDKIRPAEGDVCPLALSTASSAPSAITPASAQAAIASATAGANTAASTAAAVASSAGDTAAVADILVKQNTINTVNNAAAANLTVSLPIEQKPAEILYSAPTAGAFSKPMTTDAFNLPNRFTLFISRVKATPIFNFSQSFFNGIPGGGSSIYTINGGQLFGVHNVNFSDTFGPGLSVLRAVLLLCFGFYSIRTIILKR